MTINYTITPEKQKAWHFRMHQYFTKQPSNVVNEYIKHYSSKGDTILDPFSGTGVTGIEALTLNRKVVLFDLSPLACFISKETVRSPINLSDLSDAFNNIKSEMSEIVDFVNKASKKKIEEYEISEWYPKNIKLPNNSDFEFVEDLFDKRQLIVYSKLLVKIKKIKDESIKNQLLLIFSSTLGKVNLSYMPSEKEGKQVGGGGASIFGKYRYWKPKKLVVLDVWQNFENRFKYLVKARLISNQEIGNFFSDSHYKIHNDTSINIPKYLNENSIDYIYTDPPYGSHIAYLDLSTMWHAWLGYKITNEIKSLEIIEKGDANHSQEHYLDLLYKTSIEMFKVLKKEKYLSLVFQHKDTNLWFKVLDCFRDVGFVPENMVHQATNTSSMHKKANPLNVFGDQIIVNFIKPRTNLKVIIENRDDMDLLVLIIEASKKEIVNKIEASSEEIQKAVLNELYLKNKIHKQFIKKTNIIEILKKNFVQNKKTKKWMIKDEEKRNFISDLNPDERIFYVVTSLLKEKEKVSFDEIVAKVNIQATNGHIFTNKNVIDLLDEIAESKDSINYSLKVDWDAPVVEIKPKKENDLFSTFGEKEKYSKLSDHDKIIYDLGNLGNTLGFKTHIGLTERNKNAILNDNSDYNIIPFENRYIRPFDKNKISQIDIVWLDDSKDIVIAFEIETSTTIKSALERFYSLLNARYSAVLSNQRMMIIIPNETSRINTLKRELTEGTYSGHPFYMERKVKYIFLEDLITSLRANKIKAISDMDILGKEFKTD